MNASPPSPNDAKIPPLPSWLPDPLKQHLNKLMPVKDVITFEELYKKESHQLDKDREKRMGTPEVFPGAAGEPSVRFTPHDRFGLALSGGGIRSATFNLGVLQSLARLGILNHVDYLSTVSGGGYVGGFWTAWLQRNKARAKSENFPPAFNRESGESAEIRHLREFSRFLLPRMGFFETEFWAIVMTVLGGMLPSLLAAIAVLGITWYLWVLGLIVLTQPGIIGSLLSTFALLFYFTTTEVGWRKAGRAEPNRTETLAYAAASTLVACFFFWTIGRDALPAPDLKVWPSFTTLEYAMALPELFGICTLLLLGLRVLAARFIRNSACIPCLVGLERCAMRMLGLTAGMAAIAALWLLAAYLGEEGNELKLKATGLSTGVLAVIFAWAKKWLTEPVQQTRGGSFAGFIMSWLKRATPKALSTLVWLLMFLLVGTAVDWWGYKQMTVLTLPYWLPCLGCIGLIASVIWLFDPARVGMHEFYRSRISRCYLGASNFCAKNDASDPAALNRYVSERPKDDVTLGELHTVARPIHLVCVAANDMSGDQLGNLYRGARSAVLSGNGISLGDQTARLDDLRLSAALTASAAAFNSQMGRVSMDLGRSVAFLMSALNLRLGLWVPHPNNRHRGNYTFPGRFFLLELFGMSWTNRSNLHLSDGNHFENFGLYELVRRHCRYVLVSDCGADREVAFDDLANVLRRVREDFGVEIELDVTALRPNDNHRTRQHAVVGTIHYDGMAGTDKGTILYIKPCLTGDEPPDVLQYSTRNGEFPHEGTADQFYDEAQWESYRRLGEHAMDSVLSFFEAPAGTALNTADRLFRDARSHWHPAPDDLQVNFLAMSERCAAMEHDLMTDGPTQLRAEFFMEATAMAEDALKLKSQDKPPVAPDAAAELQILSYLVRVAQIMEDLWVAAELDRYWSHPLNDGWMNYFRRWAATPSFRRWWPVIAPLYGLGLREFVGQRFDVGAIDPDSARATAITNNRAELRLQEVSDAAKFFADSFVARQYLETHRMPDLTSCRVLAYNLTLLDYTGQLSTQSLAVGFALVAEHPVHAKAPQGPWKAEWEVGQLFVPDPLNGSGFLSKFLDAVLRFYRKPDAVAGRQFTEISVHFGFGPAEPEGKRPGRAARFDRVRDIEFYKSRGFSYIGGENANTDQLSLRKTW